LKIKTKNNKIVEKKTPLVNFSLLTNTYNKLQVKNNKAKFYFLEFE
jgi:hypothetical protein